MEPRRRRREPASAPVLLLLPVLLLVHIAYHLCIQAVSLHALLRQQLRASRLGPLSSRSAPHVERRLRQRAAEGARLPRHLAVVFAPSPPRSAALLLRRLLALVSGVPLSYQDTAAPEPSPADTPEALVAQVKDVARWASMVGCTRLSVYDPAGSIREALAGREEWSLSWDAADAAPARLPTHLPRLAESLVAALEGSSAVRRPARSGDSSPCDAYTASEMHTPMLPASIDGTFDTPATGSSSIWADGDELSADAGTSSSSSGPLLSGQSTPPSDVVFPAAAASSSRVTLRITPVVPVVSRRKAGDSNVPALHVSGASSPREYSDEAEESRLTLHLLGPGDGKAALVAAARELVWRAREGDTRGVDVKRVEELLLGEYDAQRRACACRLSADTGCRGADQLHPPEPDLLILHGGPRRVCSLAGFPPWSLRLTEILCVASGSECSWRGIEWLTSHPHSYDARAPARSRLSAATFEAAMQRFGKSEQRFGR